MVIIPPVISSAALEVSFGDAYTCVLCQTSSTRDEDDPGWVRLPFAVLPICEGCAYDYYEGAQAEDFDESPTKELFDPKVVERLDMEPIDLRRRILGHEIELLREEANASNDGPLREEVIRSLERIEALLATL